MWKLEKADLKTFGSSVGIVVVTLYNKSSGVRLKGAISRDDMSSEVAGAVCTELGFGTGTITEPLDDNTAR